MANKGKRHAMSGATLYIITYTQHPAVQQTMHLPWVYPLCNTGIEQPPTGVRTFGNSNAVQILTLSSVCI